MNTDEKNKMLLSIEKLSMELETLKYVISERMDLSTLQVMESVKKEFLKLEKLSIEMRDRINA